MNLRFGGEGLRILDFDIEARPLSWYGGDWVTKDVTAIAWSWILPKNDGVQPVGPVEVRTTTGSKSSATRMFRDFCKAYDWADMVTGHFIRGYDLPVINAALSELGLPLLGDKLSQDTKNDLVKLSGLSKSQENLAAMLGVEAPKVQMSQSDWREANRLKTRGVELTKVRVTGDVRQHMEMRARLLELGMLGSPRVWSSTPTGVGRYSP